MSRTDELLIDDFRAPDLVSALGAAWRGVSDRVMGGVSDVSVTRTVVDGAPCLHLAGDVRLENDGGFVQASLDLATPGGPRLDATGHLGLRLVVRGNGERYGVHLRMTDTVRAQQSYRASFGSGPDWETVELPFATFVPHRLETPLDVRRLRRLGLIAIGRAFRADLFVARIALYR